MRIPTRIRSRLTGPKKESDKSCKFQALFTRLGEQLIALILWLSSFRFFILLHRHLQNALIGIVSVGPVPQHVAFIMDGNRRHAKKRDMSVKKGHEAGGLTLLNICYACKKLGIKCVSAYAFSIENFNRPKEEVDGLTNLLSEKLDEFAQRARSFKDPLYGSRIKIIGDHSLVSDEMKDRISRVENITKDGDLFTLYICFPYTSRNDIYQTVRDSVEDSLTNQIDINMLTISTFTDRMYLENFSDKCDLLIRTSGHMRLSDYMLWQAHENAEIRFTPTLWPDFGFFKFYAMILGWSFFTNIQRYNETGFSIREKLYHLLPFVGQKTHLSLDMLPKPPIAVSITGEHDQG